MALSLITPNQVITSISGLFRASAITEPAIPLVGDSINRKDDTVTYSKFGQLISALGQSFDALNSSLLSTTLTGTVDTSQVTALAITNVQTDSNSTGQAVGTTETDLVDVAFTTTGGICVVMGLTTAICTNITAVIGGTVLLKIDSTTLDTRLLAYKQAVANDTIFPVVLFGVTTPTAASHTFKITGDGDSNPSFTFDDNKIIVVEFKR